MADETPDDSPLTDRELMIAQRAAKLAEKNLTDSFYREIGKAVVNRFLIIVGLVAVAFALGKGWLPAGGLK